MFHDLDKKIVEKLKFRPILVQTGTATYDTARLIIESLKSLAYKKYIIIDGLKFSYLLKPLLP